MTNKIGRPRKGSEIPDDEINRMRRLNRESPMVWNRQALADEFNCSVGYVHKVLTRKVRTDTEPKPSYTQQPLPLATATT